MAKLKVKQIEDLGIIEVSGTGVVTHNDIKIGANNITPLTSITDNDLSNGGYISGLTVSGNNIVIARTALPAADIFDTDKFEVTAPEGQPRTISIQDSYVKGLFSVAPASGTGYISGLTYADGVFTPAYAELPTANAGTLTISFTGLANETTRVFSADQATDSPVTLALAAVASTGAAANVSIADAGNIITATTVEGALQEIAAEIDAMDLTATDVVALNEGKTALQAGKISETDGKVTVETAATLVEFNQAISSTNKVATMADIADAAVSGQEAIKVENKVVSLVIDGTDKVLTQGTNGLLANVVLSYGEEDGKKYIKLTGKNGADLGKIDASDFIKDGFLQSVTENTTDNTLTFTWNTNAGITETTIDIKDLCDVYTADENYLHLNGFKFEHKTQANLTAGTYGSKASEGQFSFPKVTVDAAGHVTAMEELSISVATTVYVPKREDFVLDAEKIANGVVLTKGTPDTDSGVDVYLNGQLLAASICTVVGTNVKVAPYSISDDITLEAGDMIMVRYFVKETAAPVVNA